MKILKGYISDSSKIFKIIGFVPVKNRILNTIRIIYLILSTLLLSISILILSLLQVIIGNIFDDPNRFFMYSLTMVSISQCCLKMIMNCININYIQELNEKFIEIDKLFKSNRPAQELIDKNEIETTKMYRILTFLFRLLCSFYVIHPILSSAEKKLIFDIYLPDFVNWKENDVLYWSILFYHLVVMMYLVNGNTLCEVLCVCYLNNICGYLFVILRETSDLSLNQNQSDKFTLEMNYQQLNYIITLYENILRYFQR